MREIIVVTGALGGSASWVVDELRNDYDVVAVDRTLPKSLDIEGVNFVAADLTDQGVAWQVVAEADPMAVIHFGNIPHEENHAGGYVYENNALSTFNTLEAAGRAGAKIVWASSETVYGTHWPEPKLPNYFPVDEEHPVAPWNGYETSKLAGEAAAERVSNAYGVSVATLRPSWIQYPGSYVITPIRESFNFETAERFGNFWSYVDIRDVVSLVVAALETNLEGHEVFNAFGPDNFLGVDTADAVEAGFGDLPEDFELTGEESAFSTAKAESVFDWEPRHSWRDAEIEEMPVPDFD